jgi:hypothetical protein
MTLYGEVTQKRENGGYFPIGHDPTGGPETAAIRLDEKSSFENPSYQLSVFSCGL